MNSTKHQGYAHVYNVRVLEYSYIIYNIKHAARPALSKCTRTAQERRLGNNLFVDGWGSEDLEKPRGESGKPLQKNPRDVARGQVGEVLIGAPKLSRPTTSIEDI